MKGTENIILKLQKTIDKIATTVSAFLIAVMAIILAYNVVARFTGGGIQWYMEASQYLNLWAVCIAGISLSVSSEHLRIEAIDELLRGRGLLVSKVIVGVTVCLFYLFLAYGTFLLAAKSKQVISTMQSLKMSYIYWPLPVLSLLSAVSAIISVITEFSPDKKGGIEE